MLNLGGQPPVFSKDICLPDKNKPHAVLIDADFHSIISGCALHATKRAIIKGCLKGTSLSTGIHH